MPNPKTENGHPASDTQPASVNASVLADSIDIPTPETRPLKCYAFVIEPFPAQRTAGSRLWGHW